MLIGFKKLIVFAYFSLFLDDFKRYHANEKHDLVGGSPCLGL